MPITLLATQVPTPSVPGTAFWIADNDVNTTPPTVPQSATFVQGDDDDVPAKLNENATREDLLARYGGGAIGVAYGLVLSAGAGLLGSVSAGHAIIDGVVEKFAASSVVLAASATNCIWLKIDGTFEARSDLTPPALKATLVGIAFTNATVVTAVDESGVVYLKNGTCERSTADTGKPADTPSADWRGWTKTLVANWWWNGTEYQRLVDDLPFLKDVLASGESVRIPTNHQVQIFTSLTVQAGATLTVDGKLRVTT